MTTTVLTPWPRAQFLGNNGAPLVGGKLFTYQAGTSTKLATYSDSIGTSNTNPVRLDFRGEAAIYVPPNVAYKFVLAPANDTDPPTNPIWTVDNLVSSQLITLYGGTDIGVANAYVLTFTANFTAYADGIVIYWLPSNDNTAASTLNVNGLGAVNIVNQDGTALTANQLQAGQIVTVIYVGGVFQLLTGGISSGSFTPAWSGYGGSPPTGDMDWQISGQQVSLKWRGTQGTSNATFLTIGNLPTNLRPVTKDLIGASATIVIDNGAYATGSFGFGSLGTMQFNKGTAPPSGTGFTNSGSKGLPTGWCGTYSLQ
jgi:hypothetical protein